MNPQTTPPALDVVDYPDSDGEPMAENTLQFQWITTLVGALAALFRDRPDVFVAGDLLWYPVEGSNTIRCAPDALVVFGRPQGYRGSYMQWREDGVAPQVVFEVLSPGNRLGEMTRKLRFYEDYGVEEYYLYDPDLNLLTGWLRAENRLEKIAELNGWVSPRLGIRFEPTATDLRIIGPDGRPFATYVELACDRERAEQLAARAEQHAARLAAQLRALGVEPEARDR